MICDRLSPYKMSITENLIWATVGKVTTLLSGLVIGIFVARYLGPEQYGLMSWVISFVFLFQSLSVFGLDPIEVREEAKKEVDYNTIIGTSFAIRLILSFVSILLCIGTCCILGKDSETTLFVTIYSISIVANTLSVIRNYFFAIVQNKRVVQSEISRTLIGMVIKIALLLMKAPLLFFIIASLLDSLLLAGGYWASYRHDVGSVRRWRFSLGYAKYLIREAFPLLLTSAAVIFYQRIDQVMIGQLVDDTSVGYFAVAGRFVEILLFVPMVLAQTISPVLTQIRTRSEEEYRQKSQQFMNMSLWCSMFAAVVTSLIAYPLVRYLFGEQYLPAVVILQIMSFKTASVALSNTAGAMLVIEGLQKWVLLRDIMGCVVCVILNWYFLPRYGAIAAAWIAIISNIVAGYLADAVIPAYRHLFMMQTRAILFGIKDIARVKEYLVKKR